jgi:pilus assembly protein CpaF
MLQAMNTGHDGSLTTLHANSARDALNRLETLVLMAGMDLPVKAIRDQIASAIQLLIHQSRLTDGSRKIMAISEISGREGDTILLQDIFRYEPKGIDPEGRVQGEYRALGIVPKFVQDLRLRGIPVDLSLFTARNP